MDPNENQVDATKKVVLLSIKGIVEDQLPGEPVDETLGGLLPECSQEEEAVNDVVSQIRRVAKGLEKDTLLQQSINALPVVSLEAFRKIVDKVIADGITWESITVLLFVSGKFIVKLIKEHLQQSLPDILAWIWDFFQRRILSWIVQQGGWVSCLSFFGASAVQCYAILSGAFLCVLFVMWRAGRSS
ncbi:apoptosis regulator BAX-like [Brienomyrus brachyistius]|uniref:apoptosis regulator BAX-like n=1 Tax=Brienomyrus brachyistius TaxID=42636 RepID=UPI0020B3CC8A|nr:apoptosis regulator BAX-like [Brienomyrus brachyistius]